ncbi:MAG: sigma-70 family RNA polymerase sigma factor [Verrucomicrobiales bacterium]|nr:sigma-70 family RNA polymerase sigma factor [Verrucomicrobiales bacterium]
MTRRTETVASPFPNTRWSLILAAGNSCAPAARQALDALCALYWRPVYCYIRSREANREDARDLTQGFFEHLMEKHLFHQAQANLGRFRSYLLGCVTNFLKNARTHARAQKRGGEWTRINESIEQAESWLELAAAERQQPDRVYDWACAISVMDQALERLEGEHATAQRQQVFAALQPYLQCEDPVPDYATTAASLKTTEGTVKVLVHRLRRRYRSLMRSIVAETLSDPLGVDDELRYLGEALEAGRPTPVAGAENPVRR